MASSFSDRCSSQYSDRATVAYHHYTLLFDGESAGLSNQWQVTPAPAFCPLPSVPWAVRVVDAIPIDSPFPTKLISQLQQACNASEGCFQKEGFIRECNRLLDKVGFFRDSCDREKIFQFAEALYSRLESVSNNPYIFSAYLKVLGKFEKEVEKANAVFYKALEKGLLNPYVLSAYLKTAKKARYDASPCIRAFNMALESHTLEKPCVNFYVVQKFLRQMKITQTVDDWQDCFNRMLEKKILGLDEIQPLWDELTKR